MRTFVRSAAMVLTVSVLAVATQALGTRPIVLRGGHGAELSALPPEADRNAPLPDAPAPAAPALDKAAPTLSAAAATRFPATGLAASAVGGAIVSCVDLRSGTAFEYFAQHLWADGQLDTAWSGDAGRLCLGTTDNLHQLLCPDGAGGTYAGWVDTRAGDPDIMLQHFGADGAIAAGWPAEGLPVCDAALSQYNLDLAPDGSGGVLLVWQDFRAGGAGDIYGQHVTPSGLPAPEWPEAGRAICAEAHAQATPHVASDGSGGFYVVWQDRRAGHQALFAQHVSGAGSPLPDWPAGGAALGSGAGDAEAAAVAADITGALTVVWRQEDSSGVSVRALQVAASEAPEGAWSPAVQVLSTAVQAAGDPAVMVAAGDVRFVAWSEWRQGASALRVQGLAADATVLPGWPAGGLGIATTALGRGAPRMLAQADSGAIVAWEDFRDGTSDIYAQRVGYSGSVAPGWAEDGVAICTAAGEQYAPSLASDGGGGALLTWADAATSTQAGFFGAQPALAGQVVLARASASPGRAHLVWSAPRGLGAFAAQRRVADASEWEALGTLTLDDSSLVVLDDRSAPEGATLEYRLALSGENYVQYLPAVRLEIPVAPLRLALHRAWAIAEQNVIVLALALPRGAAPAVDMLDVMGRRIQRQTLAGLEPGEQHVRMGIPPRVPSGVYFLRLTQGSEARTAKVVLIR